MAYAPSPSPSGTYNHWLNARKVCVIGAGTMGSGIAAHLANIGFDVTLLDVSRDAAEEAFSRAKLAKPPHFYVADRAHEVRLGGIGENLSWVSEADWVCEAVVEKLDVKRSLFAHLDELVRPDAMISTNTSGLQIGLLAEGRSESFRKRFLGTHFFNPPRYLKLLELIPTGETDPEVVEAMTRFLEERVARRVVLAKDTPGFIANRYGMWAMIHAIHMAERLHLSVEQVDAITGPFLGRPRSASFRLNDLVGLDIMYDIAQNLIARCPDDPHTEWLKTPRSMEALMARGWIGDKAQQGYYRKEGKELLALDLQTMAYRMKQDVVFPSLAALSKLPLGERVSAALELRDEAGEFLRCHLVPVLNYADYLKAEISHSVRDFDRVMMWGFGWEMGPFAMMDAIGHDKFTVQAKAYYTNDQELGFDGEYFTPKPEPEYDALKSFPIIETFESFVVRDLGDDVFAISSTTKMGSISLRYVEELSKLLDQSRYTRLVLTSEAKAQSVGFDLNFFLGAIAENDLARINAALIALQSLGERLEKLPVVATAFGYLLGAGLELALSCSHIACHPESQIGLPEAKVGLLPGGRGTALMRLYNQQSAKRLAEVVRTMTEGAISSNADHARQLGYLRPTDVTVYHPDRLITEAKQLALAAHPVARPAWTPTEGPLIGMIDRQLDEAKARGVLTDYDEQIGDKMKAVVAKTNSYEDALIRERGEFLDLCTRNLTQQRIKHMLENGKPLRN